MTPMHATTNHAPRIHRTVPMLLAASLAACASDGDLPLDPLGPGGEPLDGGASAETAPLRTDACQRDDYGAAAWEMSRGPFGGDRRHVVVDPGDPLHAFTDSVDQGGLFESLDGGRSWRRAVPPGAPFERRSLTVERLYDPSRGRYGVVVLPVGLALEGNDVFVVPMDAPTSGYERLPTVSSAPVVFAASDAAPGRHAHLALLRFDPLGQLELTLDGGQSWIRSDLEERFHAVTGIAFAADGALLVASSGSIALGAAQRLTRGGDPSCLLAVMEALMRDASLPRCAAGVPLDVRGDFEVLRVDPRSGRVLRRTAVPGVSRGEPGAHHAFPGVSWLFSPEGVFRAASVADEYVRIPFLLRDEDGSVAPVADLPGATGVTVAPAPGSGQETVFLAIGGVQRMRGIFRGRRQGGRWIFELSSPGPSNRFLDFPKGAGTVADGDPAILYAPYVHEGVMRTEAFGAPGSWEPANGGLGYNVFAVEEDPSDPGHLVTTAQNVVRENTNRVRTANWRRSVVSLEEHTANLRGGVEIDRVFPSRWVVGGGAGCCGSLRGGLWLSEDAGDSWRQIVGSPRTPSANPQVYEVLQHPERTAWFFAASSRYRGDGNPGLWWSRDHAASFRKLDSVPPSEEFRALDAFGRDRLLAVGTRIRLVTLGTRERPPTAVEVPWDGPRGAFFTAVVFTGDRVLVGTESGEIYGKPARSPEELLDAAVPWRAAATSLGSSVADLAVHPGEPDLVFAGTGRHGLWRSEDGGRSWSAFNEGVESAELTVFDLEMSRCGDRLYAGTLGGMLVRRVGP